MLFDLDGTLLDTAPDLAGALNALLAEQGHPLLSLAQVRAMVGHGAVAMIEHGLAAAGVALDGALPERLRARFLDHYRARYIERTRPFPGAIEVVVGGKHAACAEGELLEYGELVIYRSLSLAFITCRVKERFDPHNRELHQPSRLREHKSEPAVSYTQVGRRQDGGETVFLVPLRVVIGTRQRRPRRFGRSGICVLSRSRRDL